MSKKSNLSSLLLLGGVAIGGYLLYKHFFSGQQQPQQGGGYSIGWIPNDATPQTPMNADTNAPTVTPTIDLISTPTAAPDGSFIQSPFIAPVTQMVLPISSNESVTINVPVVKPAIDFGYITPTAYINTTTAPKTTVIQRTGSNVNTFQNVATTPVSATRTSNITGLITVGSPTQQIQQFNTAPKLIKVGGVVRKAM